MFAEEEPYSSDSDDDSASVDKSDSAMESSSEGEVEDSEEGGARQSSNSSGDEEGKMDEGEKVADLGLFGIEGELAFFN